MKDKLYMGNLGEYHEWLNRIIFQFVSGGCNWINIPLLLDFATAQNLH